MLRVTIFLVLAIALQIEAREPTDETLGVLIASPRTALKAYSDYVEKYAGKTPVGEAAIADSKAKWEIFATYAKALWDVEASIEVGDSIFKYPGLLAHGKLSWDTAKNCYWLSLGLHPFSPGDGLGAFAFAFDLSGKVISKGRSKYPW